MRDLPLLFETLIQYFKSLHIDNLSFIDDYTLTLNMDGSLNDELSRDKMVIGENEERYCLMRVIFVVDDFRQSFNFVLLDLETGAVERFNLYPTLLTKTSGNDINLNILRELNNSDFSFSSFRDESYTFINKYHDQKTNSNNTNHILFFSVLYYLEYRLLNLDENPDYVYKNFIKKVKSNNINKYQRRITSFMRTNVGTTPKKRGVVFCHGYIHDVFRMTDLLIKFGLDVEVDWVLVNTDRNTLPDLVSSYRDYDAVKTLKHFSYDYVISMGCPIFESITSVETLVRAGRWLLRPGGSLIITALNKFIMYGMKELYAYKEGFIKQPEHILNDLMMYEYYNSYSVEDNDVIMSIL